MAATKGYSTLMSGATSSGTSSAAALSTTDSATLYVQIVQAGTPTAAATAQVQWSVDGSTYFDGPLLSTTLAAGTSQWTIAVPDDAVAAQVVYTAQTGGTSSTCTVQAGTVVY